MDNDIDVGYYDPPKMLSKSEPISVDFYRISIGLHSAKFLSGDGRTREDPSRQYGTGRKMQGKKFMVSATWNAPKAAFGNPEQKLFQGISTSDFFMHITCNYRFCEAEVMADYNCFDIFKMATL